jgi:putative oxidoreductase
MIRMMRLLRSDNSSPERIPTMPALVYPRFVTGPGAFGLLVLRVVSGAAFLFHGWPKIQSPLHWLDQMGPSAPHPYLQAAAAVSEFGGGILLIVGFLTPLAALGIGCTMAMALATVHIPRGDPFVAAPEHSSCEPAAVYLAIMITLLLVGPGVLSLDGLLFGRRSQQGATMPRGPAQST